MYLKAFLKTCWAIPLIVLPLSALANTQPDSDLTGDGNDGKRNVEDDRVIKIPQSVDELPGQEVSLDTRSSLTSLGHPSTDEAAGEVFLLYNTGTGKFLNVGGYWGTHTALSTVPRLFWFQQRNDIQVANQWTYCRYPSKQNAENTFATNFFALTHFQYGSKQGEKYSHTTYKTVKLQDLDGQNAQTLLTDYNAQGVAFTNEVDIDFSKQELEVVIDMEGCQGTKTNDTGTLETVFSIGKDISVWNKSVTDFHIYGFKNSDGTYGLRVQPLDGLYKDATHKSGGDENPITIGDDHLVTIKISNYDILVNGVSCMPRNFSVSENNPIQKLLALTSMQVGSHGAVASNATYNALAIKTGGTAGTTTNLLPDEKADYCLNGEAWTKDITPNFSNGDALTATITLPDAPKTDEDVFSVGSDIAQSGKDGENLHLIYKGKSAEGKHVLQLALYDSYYPEGLKHHVEVDGNGKFTLQIDADGVKIDGVNSLSGKSRIPSMAYNETKADEIVYFKTDSYGSFLLDKNGKYTIDSDGQGDATKVTRSGYVMTDDKRGKEINCTPLFISSNLTSETNQSGNEGNYLMFAPRYETFHKWGSVGTFIDRNLPANNRNFPLEKNIECAQWFFEPVANSEGKYLYHIFLEMTDAELMEGTPAHNSFKKYEGTHRYYLQASADNVLGNNLEDYDETHTATKESNWTAVEATYSADGTNNSPDAVWKVIPLNEYYELFQTEKSEMGTLLDMSFSIHDQDFARRNGTLKYWQMDNTLDGKVRIGYDGDSKKKPTDQDYTADGGGKISTEASNSIINHGRYMGVDVRNGGYGAFYQDAKVYTQGWFVISCGGMSNVGAQLFVQYKKADGSLTTMLTTPLPTLTDEEKAGFEATDHKWPFDQYSTTKPMPMYNALVAINDTKVNDGELVAKYNVQLPIYIDKQVLEANNGAADLRFGIYIPQENVGEGKKALSDQWTVFDDFHLLFGGQSQEPNLVLDEENTNLDYLETTLHHYDLRPMHLNRTFTTGAWNTLVLPVNLSQDDFTELFGEGCQLAHLDKLTEHSIDFKRVETGEGNVFLKAFEPYIILPAKAHGDHAAYTAQLANRSDGGKTFTTVSVPDNHFYIESATLGGKHTDEATGQSWYQFKEDYPAYILETEQATGGGHKPLVSYGTLCKTYDEDSHSILDGRPDLKDCYVMYHGAMIRIHDQYGMKGFRCWFGETGEAGQSANNLPVFIDGVADNTTGIEDIVRVDNSVPGTRFADGVYNLNGQKVGTTADMGNLPAGIYIVNGIKHIIK